MLTDHSITTFSISLRPLCFYLLRTEPQTLSNSMNDLTDGTLQKVILPHQSELEIQKASKLQHITVDAVANVLSFLSTPVCVIQSGLGDGRSQTLPGNSSLAQQNGIGDSSNETQLQRSPDGSEDGDYSQSKSRRINCGWAGCDI